MNIAFPQSIDFDAVVSIADNMTGFLFGDWSASALLVRPFMAVYLLWILYLAVMNLKRAQDAGTMTPVAKALSYPILLVGVLLDVVVNVTIGTLLFLDLPKEATLSARLSRYWNTDAADTGWRKRVADWLARNLLNTYDPSGQHIH